MFQDIEGFTGLSETMDPVSLARLTGECIKSKKIEKEGGKREEGSNERDINQA